MNSIVENNEEGEVELEGRDDASAGSVLQNKCIEKRKITSRKKFQTEAATSTLMKLILKEKETEHIKSEKAEEEKDHVALFILVRQPCLCMIALIIIKIMLINLRIFNITKARSMIFHRLPAIILQSSSSKGTNYIYNLK